MGSNMDTTKEFFLYNDYLDNDYVLSIQDGGDSYVIEMYQTTLPSAKWKLSSAGNGYYRLHALSLVDPDSNALSFDGNYGVNMSQTADTSFQNWRFDLWDDRESYRISNEYYGSDQHLGCGTLPDSWIYLTESSDGDNHWHMVTDLDSGELCCMSSSSTTSSTSTTTSTSSVSSSGTQFPSNPTTASTTTVTSSPSSSNSANSSSDSSGASNSDSLSTGAIIGVAFGAFAALLLLAALLLWWRRSRRNNKPKPQSQQQSFQGGPVPDSTQYQEATSKPLMAQATWSTYNAHGPASGFSPASPSGVSDQGGKFARKPVPELHGQWGVSPAELNGSQGQGRAELGGYSGR